MQRLISARHDCDRGASAAMVAILLTALLGFTAIAVDVGAMWSDKQQLQTGADAAALAIARDCAAGNCGAAGSKAAQYAGLNKSDANATAPMVTVDMTAGKVTVVTASVRQHWFAPVLGIDSSVVRAKASATWGWPVSGSTIPLAFSYCEFFWQTGLSSGSPPDTTTERTILLKTKGDLTGSLGSDCGTQAAHNEVSGGFGWLDSTNCVTAFYTVDGKVVSKTGVSVPSGCTGADFKKLQGATVLLPLFDEFAGSGSNATYTIAGFAGFKVTGYCFGNKTDESWGAAMSNCPSNKRIMGYFTAFISLEDGMKTSPTATPYGAAVVKLAG